MSSSKDGPSVQVVTAKKQDHSSEATNESELLRILTAEDALGYNVVIVAVAGAFIVGNSFLVDMFKCYLRVQFSEKPYDAALQGGNRVGDPKTGIILWYEVFKIDLMDGDNLAIVLMDMQGMYGSKTTLKECISIVAANSMLTPEQIYDPSKTTQEHLRHHRLFGEVVRSAIKENPSMPFQDLWFPLRDFEGEEFGGFSMTSDLSDDQRLATLYADVRDCFSRVSCILLPHPGDKVRGADYKDNFKPLNATLKKYVKGLREDMLSLGRLVSMAVEGSPLEAYQVVARIYRHSKFFDMKALATPKIVFQTTAEADNFRAIKVSRCHYMTEMLKYLEEENRLSDRMKDLVVGSPIWFVVLNYITCHNIEGHHKVCKVEAMELFDKSRKMGGEKYARPYRRHLDDEVEEIYRRLERLHQIACSVSRRKRIILLRNLLRYPWSYTPPSLFAKR